MPGFDVSQRRAIELAFEATGFDQLDRADASFAQFQTTVAEVSQAFDQATSTTVKFDAALQNQAKAATNATAATDAQAKANQAVADSATSAATATDKASAAVGATGKAAGGAVKDFSALARAILGSSQAASDFSVAGPLGAMNNVGQVAGNVAKAFGASATAVNLWAAGLEVAGAVLYGVYKNWDTIVAQFSEGLPKQPLEDLKTLKDELKDLTEKPWKTIIDSADINTLLIKVGEAERRKAALEKADGPTEEDSKRGKMVTDAVRDANQGNQMLYKAAAAAAPTQDSQATSETKAKAQALENQVNDRTLAAQYPEVWQAKSDQLDALRERIKELEQSDRTSHRTETEGRVAKALEGNEGNRQWLEDLAKANAATFAKFGIGKEFTDALAKASPAAMKQAEKDKTDEKAAKETIRLIGDAFKEDVLQPLVQVARTGGDVKAAAESMKSALTRGFVGRGVDADVAAKAAAIFLKEMREKSVNMAVTNEKTPGEKARDAEEAKEKAATQRRVNDAYGDVRGAFENDLVERLTKEGRRGGDIQAAAEQLRDSLTKQVDARDVGNGDQDIVAGVVEKLLSEAKADALNIIQNGKKTPAERAAIVAADKQAREVAGGYAGQEQAVAALYDQVKNKGQDKDQARDVIRNQAEQNILDLDPTTPAEVAAKASDLIAKQALEKVMTLIANNRKPSLTVQASQARKAEVDKIDDGFLTPAAEALAINRQRLMAGPNAFPRAKTSREAEAYEGTGTPYAVAEPVLKRVLANRVGNDLQAAGRDRGLAPDVVQRAVEKVGEMTVKANAGNVTALQSISQVVAQLAAQAASDRQKVDGVVQRMNMVRMNQANARSSRGSQFTPMTSWSGP